MSKKQRKAPAAMTAPDVRALSQARVDLMFDRHTRGPDTIKLVMERYPDALLEDRDGGLRFSEAHVLSLNRVELKAALVEALERSEDR